MKIDMITILNARLEESIEFYTQVMGFAMTRDFMASPTRRIVFLADGPGAMIELIGDAGQTERKNGDISIGFHVPNIEETHQHLLSRGVTITSGPVTLPSGVKLMSAVDPNGVALGFVEEPMPRP